MSERRPPRLADGFLRLANDLAEAITVAPISRIVTREVVDVVIRQSYGWQQKSCELAMPDFEARTGRARGSIRKGLAEALGMGILRRQQLTAGRPGEPARYRYWLNKRYWEWLDFPTDWAPSRANPAPQANHPANSGPSGAALWPQRRGTLAPAARHSGPSGAASTPETRTSAGANGPPKKEEKDIRERHKREGVPCTSEIDPPTAPARSSTGTLSPLTESIEARDRGPPDPPP